MEAIQWPRACQKAILETSEYSIFWQYLVTVTEHEKTDEKLTDVADENSQSSSDTNWGKGNFHVLRRYAQKFVIPY